MRRCLLGLAALSIVAVCFQSANAVWVEDTYRNIKRGYHRNVAWPWPYICPDRVAVREPFRIMVDNGWRRQNLLGPHHFKQETNELTTAGELRIHWIMTQAPPDRRRIFVERSDNPEITAQRMEVARVYAAHVAAGTEPHVTDTHLVSEGRPASVVDATNVRFYESMRPPVLPAATAGLGVTQ
jgi:hypothetical protein